MANRPVKGQGAGCAQLWVTVSWGGERLEYLM